MHKQINMFTTVTTRQTIIKLGWDHFSPTNIYKSDLVENEQKVDLLWTI